MSQMLNFNVFVFLIFTWKIATGFRHSCKVDGITADCSYRNFWKVPEDLPPHIQVLNLNDNNISKITNGSLKNLTDLQILTINNNQLQFIEANAFEGITNLKTLEMSGNVLDFSVYTSTLFSHIQKLVTLDISQNTNLSDHNESLRYPDEAFKILVSLQNLSVDLAPYPVFEQGFQSLKNLSTLSFKRCYLRRMNNLTFVNFSPSLKNLFVTECKQFFVAETDALKPFPNLLKIDFSDSYIHPYQAFELLHPLVNSKMEIINFHHINDASIGHANYPFELNITRDLVKYLQNICLETFDISGNNIVTFQKGSLLTFNKPECLQKIVLSVNRFAFDVEYQVQNLQQFFEQATNLSTFEYSYIPISLLNVSTMHKYPNVYTPERIIKLPQSIKKIYMSHVLHSGRPKLWQIPPNTKIECFDVSFSQTTDEAALSNGSQIIYLDVSGIDSRIIYKQLKDHPLTDLKQIIMRDTQFLRILKNNVNIFTYISGAQKVDLSNNFLWELPQNTFSDMHELKNLNLSANLFRSIPLAVIKIPNLHALDMRNNLLTDINKTFTDFFDNLHDKHGFNLRLDDNAFGCECFNSDFVLWLRDTRVNIDSNKTFKCLLPNSEESDTKYAALHFADIYAMCDSSIWMKIGICLIASFVAIFLPFTLLYSFRWRITFSLYNRFRKRLEKGFNVNFKFDVFVFYAEEDITWVKNVLIPQLESKWGLKMCIGHRDFAPGMPVADAIADSIEESRHIIFLVTPTFQNDGWGKYAVERAKYHHFSQKMQKIILITKNITVEDIPHELAVLWKDFALIEWPGDQERNIEYVWNNLRLWLFLNRTSSGNTI